MARDSRVAEVRVGPVLSHFSENPEPNLHPSSQNRTEPEPNLKVWFKKVRSRFRTRSEPVLCMKSGIFSKKSIICSYTLRRSIVFIIYVQIKSLLLKIPTALKKRVHITSSDSTQAYLTYTIHDVGRWGVAKSVLPLHIGTEVSKNNLPVSDPTVTSAQNTKGHEPLAVACDVDACTKWQVLG